MEGIGPILKRVREEKNISLEQIAEATKIRVKYLQAIENEQFELLPGAVYAKGFVNTYIRYLNIGDWPEVIEIMQSAPKPVMAPVISEDEPTEADHHLSRSSGRAKLEDKPITSKKYLILGISVVAVLALLAVQAIYNKQQPPDEDSIILPPQTNQIADNEPPGEETQPPEETSDTDLNSTAAEEPAKVYDGLELQLQIIDLTPTAVDKCWTTVSADGKSVFTETLNEGALKTITAEKSIHVKVGNGGVCKLTLNGQDLGIMGEKGQVVEKTLTLEDLQASVLPQKTAPAQDAADTPNEQ